MAGNGLAKITASSIDILSLSGSDSFLSGVTQFLPDVVLTLPLVAQTNGTYRATGSITSGLLSSTFNSSSSVVTKVVESYTLGDLKGVN